MLSLLRLQRCAWIVNFFKRTPKLTLKALDNKWEKDEIDKENTDGIGRRSWYKCFDQINLLFGVNITFDKIAKKWYISNPGIMEEDNFENYMISTLSTRLLVDDCIALNERLKLGEYHAGQWMRPIINAMKDDRIIQISYHKFSEKEPKQYTVQPYYIKEYKKNLYLIGKKRDGDYRTFEFGRIRDIEETSARFIFSPDDATEFKYRHMFGVMEPKKNQKPERILLKAKYNQPQRMRLAPLHPSQREVFSCKEYTEFELFIYPTNDFIAEIFSQIDRLEVLSPLWLRDHLWAMYQSGVSLYG